MQRERISFKTDRRTAADVFSSTQEICYLFQRSPRHTVIAVYRHNNIAVRIKDPCISDLGNTPVSVKNDLRALFSGDLRRPVSTAVAHHDDLDLTAVMLCGSFYRTDTPCNILFFVMGRNDD